MTRIRLPYAEWSRAEYGTALRIAFSGRVRRGNEAIELERELASLLSAPSVYALNSGRTALQVALRTFAELRPNQHRVIVPCYVCPAVIDAVAAVGLTPLPVPVGADLNLLPQGVLATLDNTVLAIVAPHMYGCPAPIDTLESMARANGVFLIDDAAQVVGERQGDRMLGTFGDIGLISFAQSKCLVVGESGAGGALICNNPKLQSRIEGQLGQLQPALGRLRALIGFIWNYLLGPLPVRLAYYWYRLFPAQRKTVEPALIANLDAAIARCQLRSLPERRRERLRILGLYARTLESKFTTYGMVFPQYAPDRFLARVVVTLPHSIDPIQLKSKMARIASAIRFGYPNYRLDSSGQLLQSGKHDVIELPLYSGMSDEAVHFICACLYEFLSSCGPSPVR